MKSYLYIAFLSLFAVTLTGFGISCISIYANGVKYSSDECPRFPNSTFFTAKKDIWSQWNWKYKFEGFDAKIQMKCPSHNGDADIYIDGNLVARSDIKAFSFVSKSYIKDCNGDVLYITRTADSIGNLMNLNGIKVSFEMRLADDETTVAYVKGTNFFKNDYDIYDIDGNQVSHIIRRTFDIPWKWEFTIYQPESAGGDMRVLSLLAGMKSFGSTDNDGTDGCNSYFWTVSYTVIIFVSFCLLAFIIIVSYLLWDKFQ